MRSIESDVKKGLSLTGIADPADHTNSVYTVRAANAGSSCQCWSLSDSHCMTERNLLRLWKRTDAQCFYWPSRRSRFMMAPPPALVVIGDDDDDYHYRLLYSVEFLTPRPGGRPAPPSLSGDPSITINMLNRSNSLTNVPNSLAKPPAQAHLCLPRINGRFERRAENGDDFFSLSLSRHNWKTSLTQLDGAEK